MSAAHQLLSAKSRMDSAELAQLFHSIHREGVATKDVERMWWEIDALRFELAAADERTRVARAERERLESLYWTLKMTKLPGGKI